MKNPISCEDDILRVTVAPGTVVTPELLVEILEAEHVDPADWAKDDLWDFRGCIAPPDLDFDSIQLIVTRMQSEAAKYAANEKSAFLVDSDVQYGLVRMYQSIAAGLPVEIRVFRDETRALAWLRGDRPPRL